ncbi:MAG: hypothetical protein AAFR42_02245 [Cyanobacteria bacterium J06628_6]
MRFLKYTIGGVLLFVGSITLMAGVYALVDEDAEDPRSIFLSCLIVGAFPAAGGGWMVMSARQDSKRMGQSKQAAEDKRRRDVLYQLIKETDGKFTLLQFAMAVDLPATQAREWLDDQAKLFGANFSVTEQGDIVYHFLPG